VPSEELSVFMNTAKQFKVRGLVEDEPSRNRQQVRPGIGGKPTVAARPQQVPSPTLNVPPDIRQRLPPGIQMVKRPASEASPEKRPRMNPPTGKTGPMQNQNQFGEEEDSGDDITEIREGDDSNDFYEEYPDYEDPNMGFEGEEAPMHPQGGSGPQLMGLLCPNCRQMCQGVQALKEHMQVCKGAQRGQSQPPPPGGMGAREMPEEPQECHICDKSFKSHRTLDNHMKKQHGLAAPPKPLTPNKGRGRPKKGPMMSDRQGGWQGEGGYGSDYQEGQSTSRGRPVGQVAPAQRSTDSPAPSKSENKTGQPSTSGEGFRNMPSPRGGRGRGGPQIGQGRGFARPGDAAKKPGGADGAPGAPKPDLQKLGLKFGGQISITSTGNQAKRGNQGGAAGDNQGVSVTKLKGDVPVGSPVSIRDATNTKSGQGRATPSQGEASKTEGQPDSQNAVKEEPKEFDEEIDTAEAPDADDFGDYGDGTEGDYIGPGGDGLYGDDGDYGADVDQEGMDIEYFSQYKERDEFDGRGGGMFQGEYGEEDQVIDEEYEEEA